MEEERQPDDEDWLLQPPPTGHIKLEIATGSAVELTEEARSALDVLINHLQSDEVTGFYITEPCGGLYDCGKYGCSLGDCLLSSRPCRANVRCIIMKMSPG